MILSNNDAGFWVDCCFCSDMEAQSHPASWHHDVGRLFAVICRRSWWPSTNLRETVHILKSPCTKQNKQGRISAPSQTSVLTQQGRSIVPGAGGIWVISPVETVGFFLSVANHSNSFPLFPSSPLPFSLPNCLSVALFCCRTPTSLALTKRHWGRKVTILPLNRNQSFSVIYLWLKPRGIFSQ